MTPLAGRRALHRVRDTMFSANGYRFAKWQVNRISRFRNKAA
jgi:hypothetical protein